MTQSTAKEAEAGQAVAKLLAASTPEKPVWKSKKFYGSLLTGLGLLCSHLPFPWAAPVGQALSAAAGLFTMGQGMADWGKNAQ
jgi:hypothetical protein